MSILLPQRKSGMRDATAASEQGTESPLRAVRVEAILAELKAHYQSGGLGDGKIKARLEAILQELIVPIRARRTQLSKNRAYILEVIKEGTERARERTEATKRDVVNALDLFQV